MRRTLLVVALLIVSVSSAVPARAAAGDLDSSFGGDGRITLEGSANAPGPGVATDSSGRIVVADSTPTTPTALQIQRLETDGSPDATFGDLGSVVVPIGKANSCASAVAIQADGAIVVAG